MKQTAGLRLFKGPKAFSSALNVLGFCTLLGGIFWPHPHALIIVLDLILPWLALVICYASAGTITLFKKKKDTYPSLEFLFVAPGLSLALLTINRFRILDWQPVLILTIAFTVLLVIAALFITPKRVNVWSLILGTVIVGGYLGFGTVMTVNATAAQKPMQVYRATVTGKAIEHGRSTHYDLYLSAWPLRGASEDNEVSESFYNQAQNGDQVCLETHTGLLGIRWFDIQACPAIKPL